MSLWVHTATRGPRLLGHPDVDVWNHAWGPWWWWHSLSSGSLPWRTELLKHPVGGVLWFIDPLLALLGAPLVPLIGVAWAFDLVVVASLVATSVVVGRLARELGARRGAWVASAAAVCGAWVLCALHNGITEALHLAPLAWALLEAERLVAAPSLGRGLRLGLAAGLAGAASPYVGLGLALVLGVRLLAAGRSVWPAVLPALALALVLAGGPTLLLLAQVGAADAIVKRPGTMSEALALHNAVDPRTFVVPLGFRSVDLSAEGFEHSGYLGMVALGLAAAAARRHRSWAVAGAVSLVAALGPALSWGGAWVEVGGAPVPLPWAALQALLPGLALTHPLRLAMPAVVLVAALAGVGAARLGRWTWLVLALVLVDGLVLSGAPWPVATSPATVPEVARHLAAQPGDDGVLDLPTDLGPTMATSRYLYWQTTHGKPVPWIPDVRATTASVVADPFFQLLASASPRRTDEAEALGLEHAPAGLAEPDSLADQDLRWIVLHPDLDPGAAGVLEERLGWYLGEGHRIGGALLWDLEAERPDRGGEEPPWAAEVERERRRRALQGG